MNFHDVVNKGGCLCAHLCLETRAKIACVKKTICTHDPCTAAALHNHLCSRGSRELRRLDYNFAAHHKPQSPSHLLLTSCTAASVSALFHFRS